MQPPYKEEGINGHTAICQKQEGISKWTKLPPFTQQGEGRLQTSPQRYLGFSSCHTCIQKRFLRVTTKNYLDLFFYQLSFPLALYYTGQQAVS